MKRTAIIAAIAAVTGVNAPVAMAELNSGSTLQDVISFTNGLDQRTTDAYTKAEEGTTIRAEHDQRMNELSDRDYKSLLTGASAIHYDGDKVVKTDSDLRDTITGTVMTDRNGNALKVREIQKGSDDITLRGDNGTGLHNVTAGTEDRDAVNVGQLKGTAQGLQNSIDGQGETIKAIDAAQQKESKERIAGYEQNSARITTVAEQKADKADVQEVRNAAAVESHERIATDADHDRKIGDLYDTKANAAEVNEWLETKADKDDLAKEAAQRQADNETTQHRIDGHDERISAAQDGVDRLDNVKANRSELSDAMSHNAAYFNSELSNAQADNAVARDNVLREANAHTDHKISEVNHRVDRVEKKAVNGVAAAVALSQIPQAIHAGHGNIGIGSGFYHGSQAVAAGGGYRFDDNRTTAKFGVSRAGHDTAAGAGISYEF